MPEGNGSDSQAYEVHAIPTISSKKEVAIVGGGLAGLTSGIEAIHNGMNVTVLEAAPHDDRLAEKPQIQTITRPSQLGIAQWFPFVEGGLPGDEQTEQVQWIEDSLDWYLAREIASGYRSSMARRRNIELMETPEPVPDYLRHALERMGTVTEFGDLPENPLSFAYGYDFTTLAFNTPEALAAMRREFTDLGGTIMTRRIHDQNELRQLHADAIMNCTGLTGTDVFPDPNLEGVKGHIMFYDNPGVDRIISANDLIMLPRNDRILALGCLYLHEFDSLEPTDEEARDIRTRIDQLTGIDIEQFEGIAEKLREAKFLGSSAGLRPYRRGGIRVAAESSEGVLTVHNTGHGGAGWTEAPGTAKAAVRLIQANL